MSRNREIEKAIKMGTSFPEIKWGQVFRNAVNDVAMKMVDLGYGTMDTLTLLLKKTVRSRRQQHLSEKPVEYPARHDGVSYGFGWAEKDSTSQQSGKLFRIRRN